MKNTVSFHTLGCRLNIFETDGLANSFSRLGINTVPESEKPEIVVINTCTVTNRADSKIEILSEMQLKIIQDHKYGLLVVMQKQIRR